MGPKTKDQIERTRPERLKRFMNGGQAVGLLTSTGGKTEGLIRDRHVFRIHAGAPNETLVLCVRPLVGQKLTVSADHFAVHLNGATGSKVANHIPVQPGLI